MSDPALLSLCGTCYMQDQFIESCLGVKANNKSYKSPNSQRRSKMNFSPRRNETLLRAMTSGKIALKTILYEEY